jgi:hypothetical protein
MLLGNMTADGVDTAVPQVPYFSPLVQDGYGNPPGFIRQLDKLHIRWVILGQDVGSWRYYAFSNASWVRRHFRAVYASYGYTVFELRDAPF